MSCLRYPSRCSTKTQPPITRSLLYRICRALAIENLEEISLFALLDDPMVGSRGAQWYLLFFAFQSALTLLLSVVWEPDHVDVEGWGRLLGNTAAWFRRCSSIQTVSVGIGGGLSYSTHRVVEQDEG